MLYEFELSVIVPVHNESGNVEALIQEIVTALDGRSYEVLFVEDASTDNTRAILLELKERVPTLRVLTHRHNAGQSRAIRTGVEAARGRIIATLDGDGQNDPADLPDLYRRFTRADAPADLGLVMGHRTNRQDSAWKRLGTRLANLVRRLVLKDGSADGACGLKMLRRDLFLKLPYFDHMHRFMPALVLAEGLMVEYQPVRHRPRRFGHSKYGNISRALSGIRDMHGVLWLRQRRRPTGRIDEI